MKKLHEMGFRALGAILLCSPAFADNHTQPSARDMAHCVLDGVKIDHQSYKDSFKTCKQHFAQASAEAQPTAMNVSLVSDPAKR